ncbi:MlaA family lipoprotein [Primorskyibacter sp. S87]|uniref:MlaA family lipoprotein n=1 Tax=Primorskyibacter sp. S87 TaxID=3415126 RepID=UPI003C7AEE8D
MKFLTRPLCLLTFAASVALSGCASKSPDQKASGEIFDPYENTNRSIHKFNRGVDKVFFRAASKGYVAIIPEPMINSFNYFADNLSMPSNVVDYLLQGDFENAGYALLRFTVNSTVGFAGLADPATDFRVPAVDTDFGETLHVWGFGEGAYVELPLYGPSTVRDSIGVIVNLFTNPIDFAPVRPIDNIGVYAEILRRLGDRGRFVDTVDSILYESADSYAQARLIYMQNRRFELAEDDDDAYLDLYTDPYADPYSDADPYADSSTDPYEDIYAE